MFSDVIKNTLGKEPMKGPPMDIHLDETKNIVPVRVSSTKRTPLHLRDAEEKLVNRLLDQGIVVRVIKPTDWCAPSFVLAKPHQISGEEIDARLVTNYTGINKFILRPVHPFPSPKEIRESILPDSAVFITMDALSGYFQLKLTEKASLMTTFLLGSGRYRYTRAPMGLASSGDE